MLISLSFNTVFADGYECPSGSPIGTSPTGTSPHCDEVKQLLLEKNCDLAAICQVCPQ